MVDILKAQNYMTNINLSLPIDSVSYLYRLTNKVVSDFKKMLKRK